MAEEVHPLDEMPVHLDRLSEDLREQLGMNSGVKNGPELLLKAFQALLNQRKKRVSMAEFSMDVPALAEEANKLDLDGDGFLTYKELEGGFAALHKHKMRTKQLFWTLITLLISSVILIGATFGVVWMVVDLHKDMKANGGVLVSRSTGAPLQVASTDFYVDNGVLTQKSFAPTSVNSGNLSGSSNVIPPDTSTGAIKTSQAKYPFDSINSAMSNDMLLAIGHVSISASTDASAPFIRANVDSVVRVPNVGGPGDGSVVLLGTGLGKFVLNGSSIGPAIGDLSKEGEAQLYDAVIAKPIRRRAAELGRRQLLNTGTTTCNRQNACVSNLRRDDETQCCIGQLFECSFNTLPGKSCPPGYFITPGGVYVRCVDLDFWSLLSDSSLAWVEGTWAIANTSTYNAYPIYVNMAKKLAMYFYPSTQEWLIYDYSYMTAIQKGTYIVTPQSALWRNGDSKPYTWNNIYANQLKQMTNPIHCGGSAVQVPSTTAGGPSLYMAPPYFRVCAPGYICYHPMVQLRCDGIYLMFSPSRTSWRGTTYSLLQYNLQTDKLINNAPYYLNPATNTLLVYLYNVYCTIRAGLPLASYGDSEFAEECQDSANPDPMQGWTSAGVWLWHVGSPGKCPPIPSPVTFIWD